MALILLFALWLRAGDLFDWLREPERAFFNGRPVLINFDGYYYLSQARDLLHGGYGRTDDLRGIPEPPPRPMPPPLLAVTAALLTRATSIPLEWVGALLPPLLGLSLAWPLYLIGRRFGGRLMALCAVWFGLSAEYYVYRSHLGWFDTDCLNASLVLLVSYFFMRFGMLTEFRRFRFLAAGLICSAVFVLWWDQAWSVVMLICLGPLLLAVALGHRPRGGQLWVLLAVVVLCLALLSVWRGPQVFKTPFQSVVEQWAYLNQQASGGFPGVGRSVLEQDRGTLAESARRTSGNLPAFLAGFFGLALFGWHRPRRAAVLIVPLALGLLSLFLARRFLIFLIPCIAIGSGWLLQCLWEARKRRAWIGPATLVPAAIFCLSPLSASLGKVHWPKQTPATLEGLAAAARLTGKDAVVWAWWDQGYPVNHFSQRATINDGSLHGGLRTVVNALPLATENPLLAANFMHFYVARGLQGMQAVFAAAGGEAKGMAVIRSVLGGRSQEAGGALRAAGLSPEAQWRAFFFPPAGREIYLLIDPRTAGAAYWWSWFGSWDVEKQQGDHAALALFSNCRREGGAIVGSGVKVDLTRGSAQAMGGTFRLRTIRLLDGIHAQQFSFDASAPAVFVLQQDTLTGALMDPGFARSLFARLYLRDDAGIEYFSLHASRFPYYQLWRVGYPSAAQP